MNKSNSITFFQYEAVLKELGFQKTIVPKRCVVYEHGPSKTTLYVRLHAADEVVPWQVLAVARRHLSERGVIEPENFEAMLQAVAA